MDNEMYISEKIQSARENNFDFLRFFAATLVIFSHSYALTGVNSEPYLVLTGYASFGMLAVDIFFILSGFLIVKSWLDKPLMFDYLKKRFLRIIPGLCVAVMLTVFILGPMVTTLSMWKYFSHPLTTEYIKNAYLSVNFFLPGVFAGNTYKDAVNGSLWTLPIEFKFYIFVLILGLINFFRKRILSLLGVIVLWGIALMNIYHPLYFNLDSLQQEVLRTLLYFSMGAVFYLYRDKVRLSRPFFALAVALLILTFHQPFGALASYLVLPYIILFVGLHKIKALNIFSKYGDFSYGLYIYAFPIQQTLVYLAKNEISVPVLFIEAFLLTLLFAIGSWFLVEKPFLKLKSVDFSSLAWSAFLKMVEKPVPVEKDL